MEKLSSAVRQTADGVVITDRDGHIEYVNPAVERLTGYRREELIGQTPRIFKSGHHSDEFYRKLWQRILAGQVNRDTFVNRGKKGELIHVEHTITPMKDESGRITSFISLWKDITERRRQEAEKSRLEEQLRQAQKMEAVGQLTAGIAHNFNNLLMGILNNLELAQMENVGDPTLLEETESIALRAAEMIDQMMLFSRAETPVDARPLAIDQVVGQTVAICQKTFDRKISIQNRLPEGLPAVLGDATQLEQVFLNLLINARDAFAESKITAPKIRLSAEILHRRDESLTNNPQAREDSYLHLLVEDNGPGIPPQTRSRIFEPFFTTKKMGRGTGLGLATVYAIVQEHGGWITCDSLVGAGTTFSIYLPVNQAETSETPTRQADVSPVGGDETVLVVEDEETVRHGLVSLLERSGYRVMAASDGLEGLELFRRSGQQIDLVLLDLSLPRLTGREVLEQMRELDPECRVIISTGFATSDVEDLGAQMLLKKPYRMTRALQAIRQILDQ